LLEKYFDCEHLSIEDTESFSKMFAHVVNEQKPEKWKKRTTNFVVLFCLFLGIFII